MKNHFPISALCLLLLVNLSVGLTSFRRLFVDSSVGSDSRNDGTQELPWKTINFALSKANPGDTIFLTGTFTEDLALSKTVSIRGFKSGTRSIINGVVQILTTELRDAVFSNLELRHNTLTQFYVPDELRLLMSNVKFDNVFIRRSAKSDYPFMFGSSKVYIGITGENGLILQGLGFTSPVNSTSTINVKSFSGPISLINSTIPSGLNFVLEGNDLNVAYNQFDDSSTVIVDDVRNGFISLNDFALSHLNLQALLGPGQIQNVSVKLNIFGNNDDNSTQAVKISPRKNSIVTVYLAYNQFVKGRSSGIIVDSQTPVTIFASHNYWGDQSGPYVARYSEFDEDCNLDGAGVTLSRYVKYRPWCDSYGCSSTVSLPGVCVYSEPDATDTRNNNYAQVLAAVLGSFAAAVLFALLILFITVAHRYEPKPDVETVDLEAQVVDAAEGEGGSDEDSGSKSGSKSSGSKSSKSGSKSGSASGSSRSKSSGSKSQSSKSGSASKSKSESESDDESGKSDSD